MRHTVKDIRFYIYRLNSISKYRYRLDESYGYINVKYKYAMMWNIEHRIIKTSTKE